MTIDETNFQNGVFAVVLIKGNVQNWSNSRTCCSDVNILKLNLTIDYSMCSLIISFSNFTELFLSEEHERVADDGYM